MLGGGFIKFGIRIFMNECKCMVEWSLNRCKSTSCSICSRICTAVPGSLPPTPLLTYSPSPSPPGTPYLNSETPYLAFAMSSFRSGTPSFSGDQHHHHKRGKVPLFLSYRQAFKFGKKGPMLIMNNLFDILSSFTFWSCLHFYSARLYVLTFSCFLRCIILVIFWYQAVKYSYILR